MSKKEDSQQYMRGKSLRYKCNKEIKKHFPAYIAVLQVEAKYRKQLKTISRAGSTGRLAF